MLKMRQNGEQNDNLLSCKTVFPKLDGGCGEGGRLKAFKPLCPTCINMGRRRKGVVKGALSRYLAT